MRISEMTRRISYSPFIGACIRRAGLRKVRQWTYATLRGNPRVVNLLLNGVEARFSSRTPHQLRCVEGTWFCEQRLLGGVLSRMQAGDVFLDVGSNLGLFTVFAAKLVGPRGTVLAFEPETSAYGRLTENVRLNNLQNVRLYKMALSDRRATKRLIRGDPGAVSQSAHFGDNAESGEEVEVSDSDWLVGNQSFPVPRAVKMDVEGHEFAALKGMRSTLSNPSCVALFCEIHPYALPEGITPEHVLELVQSFGFDSIHAEKRFSEVHVVAEKLNETGSSGKT